MNKKFLQHPQLDPSNLPSNAIEKFYCEIVDTFRIKPYDADTSEFITTLLSNKLRETALPGEEVPYQLQIIDKRLEHVYNFTTDIKLKFFILFLTEGNPGKIVSMLTIIQYKAFKLGLRNVTFSDFFIRMFPNGFYNFVDLMKIWKTLKLAENNNLLDNKIALQSILFPNE